MSELGPAPDYTEGQGPIVWTWDSTNGGWNEPRDMGWIPKIQAHVDEVRLERLKEQNSDFAEWENELGS